MSPPSPFTSLARKTSLFLLAASACGADAPISPEAREFFEQKIRPTLSSECSECHNATKHKGGLRLDYRDGWKKGGDSGDAIIPGDAKNSLLIASIRHEDPDLKMPDKAPKLDDQVIADFEKWVNMGAPDPRDEPPADQARKPSWPDLLAARRGWWSLQPVVKPTVPEVKNRAWSEHPVDRFLLAKMEVHGLAPAPAADPRIVIRRLTFALTGLPPTPTEVEAFSQLAVSNFQLAISQAAARLLASPRFGEHWARHWLDLMRYAETHGSEGDPEIREAWRFRDYVIRAFNDDVPADQLIREHLAGDLLPKPRISTDGVNESMLGIAQFRLVEHGFQPIDTLDDQVKAVDNQIDVVSKAFMGLTVSCARCHDHKFDAISQRDWTAMYGIFASCRPAQVTIDTPAVQATNRAPLERLHGEIKNALADAWSAAAARVPARLQDASARARDGRAVATQIQDLEKKIADLEWSARREMAAGAVAARDRPAPIAAWSFENGASDAFGNLDGHLEGGAEVRDGRLILDGKGAFLRTEALPIGLRAKTFEAWVAPTTLDQRGGGIVSIESTAEHSFDSIVFAEKEPRRWVAGSNHFTRSENAGGPEENAKPGALIHIAVTYAADDRVTLYRNGEPYGHSYSKAPLHSFQMGKARVLIGLRHKGAGGGFFSGEIEEARLYDRALTAAEMAASFRAGAVPIVTPQQISASLTPEQRQERDALRASLEKLRANTVAANPGAEAWEQTMADAMKSAPNPLHLWARLSAVSDDAFPAAWSALTTPMRAEQDDARRANAANFRPVWNLAGGDYAKWFPYGSALGALPSRVGEFAVAEYGERVIDGIHPGGAVTHRISEKHNALLTSPRFKIETDNISVRAFGAGGAAVRVIVDNYPLPINPIYPKAVLDKDQPGWVRIDTAYRKGSQAYVEFGTREDLTRPLPEKKDKAAKSEIASEGRSHFGVEQIVFHDGKDAPVEEVTGITALLAGDPKNAADLAAHYGRTIAGAVAAWRRDQLTESQRVLLDASVRAGALPVTLAELPAVKPLIAEYRRLEAEIPKLRRAPGVLETVAYDAPFLPRGDHLKPGETVPRGFLEVLDAKPYATTFSGRLELANDITDPRNPLTARVMVNRVWHWLFGRGIVPTVDNFGRLGEKPTHPELLDFLAARFVEEGWSFKRLIAILVSSRAFQMSSEPSPAARGTDPANAWLSHMRVRRLEAEAIRDSLLAVSGGLDETLYGKPRDFGDQRRSLYLNVRRTNLNPFLQVFDAPNPFTTLGRREATNVPAQSLTMLNSPFVIEQAGKWARRLAEDDSDTPMTRIDRMFLTVFARHPAQEESIAASAYLQTLARDRGVSEIDVLRNVEVWQDLAQSLFNLKEFIYVR